MKFYFFGIYFISMNGEFLQIVKKRFRQISNLLQMDWARASLVKFGVLRT